MFDSLKLSWLWLKMKYIFDINHFLLNINVLEKQDVLISISA